jgi:hypothetical protein
MYLDFILAVFYTLIGTAFFLTDKNLSTEKGFNFLRTMVLIALSSLFYVMGIIFATTAAIERLHMLTGV